MAFYPARYEIALVKFHIDQTRSFHEDTDSVSFGAKAGSIPLGTQFKWIGNVNNGDHHVGLRFVTQQIDDPSTPITFNYQVVNAGHQGNVGRVQNALDDGSDQMLADSNGMSSQESGVDQGTGGSVWDSVIVRGVTLGFEWLGRVLTANCDGSCAIDQVSQSAQTFFNLTDNPDRNYVESRRYRTASPSGCGTDDQDYRVFWAVGRLDHLEDEPTGTGIVAPV